jgi:histidinol-phosphate aminotransferase
VPGIQPPDGEGWVKLNTNESPHPPSPAVAAALATVADSLRLYPDPTQRHLREAAAQAFDVGPEQVVGGNGADEVLAMAVRAFAAPGEGAAFLDPSYSLVPALLQINGVRPEAHAFGPGYTLPKSFIESPARLKFLTNPNSPTGTLVGLDAVAEVCRASSGVVVLDEAYADFAPHTGLAILDEHPNLLVVRSMSKSYGLAGLRVGLAVGSEELVGDIWAIKDICNLGRPQLAAAAAALGDRAHWRQTVEEVRQNRTRLTQELAQRGWEVLPSAANFVFTTPPRPAAEVYRELLSRRVLVRYFDRPLLRHGVRISVGTWEQCEALLAAVDEGPA